MQNETLFDSIQEYDPNAVDMVPEHKIAYYMDKRILDFVLAFLLLVLLSPLIAVTASAILIFSPGPVFFKQERVGVIRKPHGRHYYWKKTTFPCYKFRTMKINADPSIHQAYVRSLIENDEAQMDAMQGEPNRPRKLVNDSRVTRIGKILRKLSLDEVPQLVNVLLGHMSLVGPRPAIPYEVELYKPSHFRRLRAQPGITGLQQVTARCVKDFDHQIRLDWEYIDNQSLWLDMKIILKTLWVVISTRGAY